MITIEETKVDGLYIRQYFPARPLFSANKVLFFHGYPGSQKNYDLAEHLALKGFECYVWHYRGAWKSEGLYSLVSNYKDSETVLNFLQKKDYGRDSVSLVGASWGGFVALEMFARNPDLKKVVLLAPFINMGSDEKALQTGVRFLYSITKPAIRNYEKEDIEKDLRIIEREYNPLKKSFNALADLDGSKVLIIHGENDTICPIEYSVKIKSLFKTPARLYQLDGQDHFLHTRETVFDFCFSFLKEE
ncbi:MAG: alpha/beta hydrolase [Deltaproteobacteria bacterium]|nr:alpha/beta hydrolase [Deltaproteobacteria bacterium]